MHRMSHKRARCGRNAPSGFTLVELMFAVMIIGIGLTMVAAAFPAGVEMNQSSTANVIGMMAARNGLALAKARLTHPLSGVGSNLQDITDRFGEKDLTYPIADDSDQADDRLSGWRIFARRYGDRNDYLLVIVAYTKSKTKDEISVTRLSGSVEEGQTKFSSSELHADMLNAAVIGPDGGWARIDEVDPGDAARLSRRLRDDEDVSDPYVVHEDGEPLRGTYVLTTRTGLRPERQ